MVGCAGALSFTLAERNLRTMDKLEMATRQLAEAFEEKRKGMNPGKRWSGSMFWDDCDHCIYAEFFGSYESGDKARIAADLITAHEELCLPYSLRIGFQGTEQVARKTMMEWFGAEEPEGDEDNQADG